MADFFGLLSRGLGLSPSPQTGMQLGNPAMVDAAPLQSQDLAEVAAAYPRLAPHIDNLRVQWGQGPPEYQSEFYPPWESSNPNSGKSTLEFYNRKLSKDEMKQYVPAEMLHYLGAVDPSTNQPVDANWQAMKQQMIQSRTPDQIKADVRNYQAENPGIPFPEWLQKSRADAYLRGAIFPNINPGWEQFLTADQKAMARRMGAYLRGTK